MGGVWVPKVRGTADRQGCFGPGECRIPPTPVVAPRALGKVGRGPVAFGPPLASSGVSVERSQMDCTFPSAEE